ncbi:flagellin hook IN motif-containing protein, partial [Campylobacter canadensis]|uniref:flagellin hook IN motif-containing protein n=1 Tax=Campylobacter canadensis TaxID=449520 RepID=UPI00295F2CF0
TTSFNGQKLLSGNFSNKEFQIGAYSNETVKASIGATTSDKIGLTRFETGHNVRAKDMPIDGKITLTFKNVDGINDVTLEPVQVAKGGSTFAGGGLGALAEAINKSTDKTGIKASVSAISVFESPIRAGKTSDDFSINGVKIGSIEVKDKDGNGALVAAINAVTDQTGVKASVDSKGRLTLANNDGRGIQISDGVSGLSTQSAASAATGTITEQPVMAKLAAKGANGKTVELGKTVDLNKKETWLTTQKGNDGQYTIAVKENSFEDVKSAMSEIIARSKKEGFDQGVEALTAYDSSKLKGATIYGALNLLGDDQGKAEQIQAAEDGIAKEITDGFDKLKKISEEVGATTDEQKAAIIQKSNEVIDGLKTRLQTFVDKAAGTTMDTTDAKKGLIAAQMIGYLDGMKAGLNGSAGELANIAGATAETATNFGRLSLSSNNGRDIVVEVKDGSGANANSAIGFDKNVTEKTISLRETNATISKEDADAMGFNTEEWQASGSGDNQNGYPAGVM